MASIKKVEVNQQKLGCAVDQWHGFAGLLYLRTTFGITQCRGLGISLPLLTDAALGPMPRSQMSQSAAVPNAESQTFLLIPAKTAKTLPT